MTKPLYYDSIQSTNFTANVISCEPSGEQYNLILDQTAFYPTGGAMDFDKGTINGQPVLNVIKKGNQIIHQIASPINETTITGLVDFTDRKRRIQYHDAQHLLSAIFEKNYQMVNTSHHVYENYCDLDFETEYPLTTDLLAAVEAEANQLIFKGKNIEVHMIPKSQLSYHGIEDNPLYSDPVRVINIESLDDMIPCGCLHFDNLRYVQLVKLLSFEKIPRGYRLFFSAGQALTDLLQETLLLQRKICQLTTSNEVTVYEDISHVITKNKQLSEQNEVLLQAVLQNEFLQLVQKKDENNFASFAADRFTLADMRVLMKLVNNHEEPLICLLQTKQADDYQFILCKSKPTITVLEPIFQSLKDNYQVIGGGKGLSINGKSSVSLLEVTII